MEIKLNLWQRFLFWVHNYVCLRWEKRPGRSNYQPIYLVKCKNMVTFLITPMMMISKTIFCALNAVKKFLKIKIDLGLKSWPFYLLFRTSYTGTPFNPQGKASIIFTFTN